MLICTVFLKTETKTDILQRKDRKQFFKAKIVAALKHLVFCYTHKTIQLVHGSIE